MATNPYKAILIPVTFIIISKKKLDFVFLVITFSFFLSQSTSVISCKEARNQDSPSSLFCTPVMSVLLE